MKTKFLLSTLLGGALLAACTADDTLDVKVAQGVNPDAPVFSVGFDEELDTRAIWLTKGNKVGFQENVDLMSLFHSIAKYSDGITSIANYQNAIYSGTGDDDGKMTWNTKAYVGQGGAIMVYPADTVMADNSTAKVHISLNQDENTKLLAPHMSEVLDILKYGEYDKDNNKNVTAGYDRKYDIVMRRIASAVTFKLTPKAGSIPDLTQYGVPAMVVNKMSLHSETNNTFTDEVTLAVGIAKVHANEGAKKGEEPFPIWAKSSDISNPTNTGKDFGTDLNDGKSIYTSDVDENTNVATFTMLPNNSKGKASGCTEVEGGSLVVHTTYGTVTLTDKDGGIIKNPVFGNTDEAYENYQQNEGGEDLKYLTVSEALNLVSDLLWTPAAKTNEYFAGENIGRYLPFSEVLVDMSKVEMDGMHIANEEKLNIALTVYEKLELTEPAQFILDGDEKGEFFMSKDTWERVVAIMADENSKITFSACNDEAKCDLVVLEGNKSVVPAMKFNTKSQTEKTPVKKVKTAVNVGLSGTWTWSDEVTQEKELSLDRVYQLVVKENAELSLDGAVVNVKNNISADAYQFTLANRGEVKIANTVYLMNEMSNFGKITIPTGNNRFNMYDGGKLTNREEQGQDATGWCKPVDADDKLGNSGGVIDIWGTLAIVESAKDAWIDNYGTINIMDNKARVLITNHYGGDISKAFDNTAKKVIEKGKDEFSHYSVANCFGIINLKVKDAGNSRLSIANNEGFIKYDTKITPDDARANYAVVTGSTIPATKNTYVELKNNGDEITVGNLTVNALIIPEGMSIFIPNNTSVLIKEYLYLTGGAITRAGSLTPNTTDLTEEFLTGYFGGNGKDKDNIFSNQE